MKKFLLILISALAMVSCRQQLTLVEEGASTWVIIIPQSAGQNDSTAAIYLQQGILNITGVQLPVYTDGRAKSEHEICIGKTNRKSTFIVPDTKDGFIVSANADQLSIMGSSGKGTIYGVINLLEHWGCRVFSPTESYFPQKQRLTLDKTYFDDEPANTLRIINGGMTRNQVFVDWLRIHTIAELSPPGYFVHTFERLVPREVYFDQHPEYYAWLNNKYSFDQLCPSNPEVKKLIIAALEKEMERYPDFDVWSVSQNDNFTYCHCDSCSRVIAEEGSPAGPIIRLVNDIAAVFPQKTISTLAYQFSRPAPKITRPADNVMIMLCTIELNRSRPIETDSLSQSFVKDIEDWGKICNNIYLWDYTINFNHSISPFPNLHVLQPNLQFFYKNNVRMQFPQSNLLEGLEFVEYRAKLLSALLWNPEVNFDSVKTDFLENYYREAAPMMRKYSEIMEKELIKSGKILYIYEPPTNHADGYLSAPNIALYNQLFDEAEAAAAYDTVLLNRVKLARLPLQYAMMEIGKNEMFGDRGWYLEKDGRFILKDEMAQTLEDFYSVCLYNNLPTLNERSLYPEIYYESTKRFIDVKVEGNLAFRKPVTCDPLPSEKYSKGDQLVLTNGVQGAHDFAVHWLGWWGQDATITVDLESMVTPRTFSLGTLWDGKSWILHPAQIGCLVSSNGKTFQSIGVQKVPGEQQNESRTRKFEFDYTGKPIRFVRFNISGAGPLPRWHASEGEPSWFFVDEVTAF